MRRIFEEARQMIYKRSVSEEGTEEVANYAVTLMKEAGLNAFLQPVSHSFGNISKKQFNVIGVLGDPLVDRTTKKGLSFVSALDTYCPGVNDNWKESGQTPFDMTIKNEKVYGLGTASGKIDFLCKLHAIERFREKKLKMPIYLIGTCGNNLGFFGTRYLIKSVAVHPKYVMVGESSDLLPVDRYKGANFSRIHFRYNIIEKDAAGFNRKIDLWSFGRMSNAAFPELGQNAITQLIEFLEIIRKAGFEYRVTEVHAGESDELVPDQAFAQFFVRSENFEEFKSFLRDYILSFERERAFRVEIGGLGEAGIRFIPEELFRGLVDTIEYFKAYSSELKGKEDNKFHPSESTLNLSRICFYPAELVVYFDKRLLPEDQDADKLTELKNGLSKVFEKYPSLNITVTTDRSQVGTVINQESILGEACKKTAKAMEFSGLTEAVSVSSQALLFNEAGYETVGFGPGPRYGSKGSPDEFCVFDQVEKATFYYKKLIESICV